MYVLADTDQEEVAKLISQYNLTSIPVVDEEMHLLGRITFDDVIDVLEEENTEDILKISGVSEDEELAGNWREAVKSRLPWLVLNLGTAFLAASVIRYFHGTIAQLGIIAGYMTMIAGMGGNAATQALAVTVRRISLNDLTDNQEIKLNGNDRFSKREGKYFNVNEEDIKKLDRYESEYYKKIEIKLKSGIKSLVYTERIYM